MSWFFVSLFMVPYKFVVFCFSCLFSFYPHSFIIALVHFFLLYFLIANWTMSYIIGGNSF